MRIISEEKLGLDDVLLVPQRNTLESRSQVELEREFKFYHSSRTWKGIPFFAANLACLSSFELADALRKHKICTALHKFHSVEQLIEYYTRKIDSKLVPELKYYADSIEQEDKINYVWVSIGMSEEDIIKIAKLHKKLDTSPNIIIDVPNGHIEKFVHFCRNVRDEFPESIIMGGNVVTHEACHELILHGGLDIVKIQIGSGKLCTTRLQTGVGYGNLSCTMECSSVHGLKNGEKKLGLICSDGGLNNIGDCSKMYCAGADFLMSGSLFYGVDEACGEWEYKDFSGEKFLYLKENAVLNTETMRKYRWPEGFKPSSYERDIYQSVITHNKDLDGKIIKEPQKTRMRIYGMSSKESQIKHYGEYKKYRASEGRSQYADYKGPADETVQELLGGLRSTATYIGANSLKDFNKCAVFCKVNQIHRNMSL